MRPLRPNSTLLPADLDEEAAAVAAAEEEAALEVDEEAAAEDETALEADEASEDTALEMEAVLMDVEAVAAATVLVTEPLAEVAPHRACWRALAACWSEVVQLLRGNG
jgi:hypothetical protein